MENRPANLDNWDDFLGKWLKAERVKTWPAVIVVTNIKGEFDADDEVSLILDIQYDQKKLKFQLNKTNIQIIRDAKLSSPRAIIGKKITLKQVMNFNPQIGKKVPSLEIEKIE